MRAFSTLLDRLVLTPQRNGKLRLLADYFRETSDPDRGYALAAITRDLDIRSVKPAMIRALAEERMDPVLFRCSYDYVGDMAETISLVWPAAPSSTNQAPRVSHVIEALNSASRSEGAVLIAAWLDNLDASGRYALLKLVTGGLRIGVSSRIAKLALAGFGEVDVAEIEELWHALSPPYETLFAWLEGRAEKPEPDMPAPFRPVMLAHPLLEKVQRNDPGAVDEAHMEPETFAAEWKWDGIRVQAVSDRGERRLYSRTGDDIGRAFPDVLEALEFDGAIDGELLVMRPGTDRAVAPFGDLQQRLNRKTVSKRLLQSHPAFIRAYDVLCLRGVDTRPLPFRERRWRLEALVSEAGSSRIDLSPLISYEHFSELARMRNQPPDPAIEGLMLKRWDSVYVTGRPRGPWFKWKRDPYLIDAVLLYAQRGHGKRSSFYSDFTFGVWRSDDGIDTLVPVGKAYFGFTDEELTFLDKFVRDNTVERFGPVRSVKAGAEGGLVLEVAFEGLNRSTRHKSGVAMRFPRIHRIRHDKSAGDADRLDTLMGMLDP